MHREKRLEELCILYRENRATAEEAQELLAYFASQPPEALDRLLRPIQEEFQPAPHWQPPIAVADIVAMAQQHDAQQQLHQNRRYYRILYAAAAFLAVVAGICYFTLQPTAPKTVRYATGKYPATYTLPDSSVLTLLPASSLTYTQTSQQRILQLTGAASFTIAAHAQLPCTIQANNLFTQILGTTLSIDATPGKQHTTVALLSGSLQVKRAQTITRLLPGQQIEVPHNNGQSQVKAILAAPQQSYWLGQDTLLNNLRYDQVAALLTLRFGVTVSFEAAALRAETIHTDLKATESLPQILDNLAALTGSRYQLKQQHIYIRK